MAEALPMPIPIWAILIDTNCSMRGGSFLLEMPASKCVDHMKTAVMQRAGPLLRDCSSIELKIWKLHTLVPLPETSYETTPSDNGSFNTVTQSQHSYGTRSSEKKKGLTLGTVLKHIPSANYTNNSYARLLLPSGRLKDIFTEPNPDDKLQVIVQFPNQELQGKHETIAESVSEPLTPRIVALKRVADLSPPSETLGPAGKELRDNVLIGRPGDRYGLPNALYHPVLAKLQYKLENLNAPDNDSINDDLLEITRRFFTSTLREHPDEKSRWSGSKEFFEFILGDAHEQERIYSSKTNSKPKLAGVMDVVWGITPEPGDPLLGYGIAEIKQQKGIGGDPLVQVVKYYGKMCYELAKSDLFNSTLFPIILISVNGHILEISTALSLEQIVINELLQFNMRDGYDCDLMIRTLARIASASKECASQLKTEYEEVVKKVGSAKSLPAGWPSPTKDPSYGSTLPTLNFRARLNRRNESFLVPNNPSPSIMRSLFVADMDDPLYNSEKKRVVVKFTQTYNKEAHIVLADANLAPKLHACIPLIGNMFMVVTDHLDGKPMELYKGVLPEDGLKSTAFDDIQNAVTLLSEKGLVHGDLRALNIIIDFEKEHAKVVDFDWAGKAEVARYPLNLNKDLSGDEWHKEVKAGGVMKVEHDGYALNEVLKCRYPSLNM